LKQSAHARLRLDNPQRAAGGGRHVQRAHQFADAGRVDRREPREIEEYPPLATSDACSHGLAQPRANRRSKGALQLDDGNRNT
jgi:hypothetical protein